MLEHPGVILTPGQKWLDDRLKARATFTKIDGFFLSILFLVLVFYANF